MGQEKPLSQGQGVDEWGLVTGDWGLGLYSEERVQLLMMG
jgi:hypothetical protein